MSWIVQIAAQQKKAAQTKEWHRVKQPRQEKDERSTETNTGLMSKSAGPGFEFHVKSSSNYPRHAARDEARLTSSARFPLPRVVFPAGTRAHDFRGARALDKKLKTSGQWLAMIVRQNRNEIDTSDSSHGHRYPTRQLSFVSRKIGASQRSRALLYRRAAAGSRSPSS